MVRRGRRKTTVRNSPALLIGQVTGLVLLLVMILLFRDKIATGASVLLGGFESSDIRIETDAATPDEDVAVPNSVPDTGLP